MPKIRVNYKSGNSMVAKCKSFEVKFFASGAKEYIWEGARPKPLDIGADEIESVWVL